MGRNEQREEREVLDSIFPDEIQDLSENEYRISITLDVQQERDDDIDSPVILLNVRYPEIYPDEAPDLDITQPYGAPRCLHLDVAEDKVRLLDSLRPTIEENMGMAMIFSLVSTVKDAAEALITERQQAVQAEKEQEVRQAEEEENRKFEGEKVTRETFLAWRMTFQQEQAEEKARKAAELEAEEKKRRGGKTEDKRMTGRQLWEQGLAGKTMEEDEDGEDAVEGLRGLRVAS